MQYASGVRAEHMAVRERCGIFDVSHMGEIETAGPGAERSCSDCSPTTSSQMPVGGAQYSVLCREERRRARRPLHLPVAPDRYLTVTNASNHESDLACFRAHADGAST